MTVSPSGRVTFERELDAEPIMDVVKEFSPLITRAKRSKDGKMYLGTVDQITAANWAKECGSAIGTREWNKYAKKKLMSGEFSRFKADLPRY